MCQFSDISFNNHHHHQNSNPFDVPNWNVGFDVVEELVRGAGCFDSNELQLAQARLRSPVGKPLQLAAFYFKEALISLLTGSNDGPVCSLSSSDIVSTKLVHVIDFNIERFVHEGLSLDKRKPPALVSLCLGLIGKHFEDIIPDLGGIAVNFPADIKMAMAAIARRRKLLNDDVIISLADSSWETLDISGSDVSDSGLATVTEICKFLRAVDISRCSNITALGVSELVRHCHLLKTLRCGGCRRSDYTARRCLGIFKPKLNDVEGESWEELETMEIGDGAQSLRWLVWPKIDSDSLDSLSTECPRIVVNPKPSPFGFRGIEVPREAFPDTVLDDSIVKDLDPKTWAVFGFTPRIISPSVSTLDDLPMAEKFRLAFVERDTRLAPKRAKNARQHQRRAEREKMTSSTDAKAIALASRVNKSLFGQN